MGSRGPAGKGGQPPGMPPSPGASALGLPQPGSNPMNAISRLPGMGGGTGVSSGQQGQFPWIPTGKPMDQEMEAQRLLSGQPAAAPQMPGGGMFQNFAQQQGAANKENAISNWLLNNANQGGGGAPMQKPQMAQMASMLASQPQVPLGPQQANMAAGGGAAAMGEPASYGKSGGAGKAQAAKMAARRGR